MSKNHLKRISEQGINAQSSSRSEHRVDAAENHAPCLPRQKRRREVDDASDDNSEGVSFELFQSYFEKKFDKITERIDRERITSGGLLQSVLPDVTVKGRLKRHFVYWKNIGANANVLKIIAEGYTIPFFTTQEPILLANSASAMDDFVTAELGRLLATGSRT